MAEQNAAITGAVAIIDMKDEIAEQKAKRGIATIRIRGGRLEIVRDVVIPLALLKNPLEALRLRSRARKPKP